MKDGWEVHTTLPNGQIVVRKETETKSSQISRILAELPAKEPGVNSHSKDCSLPSDSGADSNLTTSWSIAQPHVAIINKKHPIAKHSPVSLDKFLQA